MKNFAVKVDGKEYWISRAIATVLFVFKKEENKVKLLVERRGKGAADNQGKLCVVCGYLDFNEDCRQCAARECLEECGFKVKRIEDMELFGIIDDPKQDARQNVSFRYAYWADEDEDFDMKKAVGGEKDEVAEVKWFELGTLSEDETTLHVNIMDIMEENWAFEHNTRLVEYLSTKYRLDYGKEKGKE